MTYCTDYDRATCCDAAQEDHIRMLVESLDIPGTSVCLEYVKDILCAACDPWGAHLFETESGGDRLVPYLCDGYCGAFYDACSSVHMDWDGVNYFGGTSDVISDNYPTRSGFCSAHAPRETFGTCYSGAPFVPTAPPPPPLGSPILCVEQLAVTASDSTCCRITNVISAHDGTERLFLTTQGGVIRILSTVTFQIVGTFLTLPSVYTTANEAGLIGLVFHPRYASNGRFFVHYSCPRSVCSAPCVSSNPVACNGGSCVGGICQGGDHVAIVSEFRVSATNPNVANPASERRLLRLVQPFGNHNSGTLLFGANDTMLYVFFGDGGSANDPGQMAQHPSSFMGKVVRIDVDSPPDVGKAYHVPSGNPFPSRIVNEAWAEGLRNPWRCTFDSLRPGYLFCGDVGQDNREEVDLIVKGGNYGWRKYEGTRLNVAGDAAIPERVDPILEHSHSALGGNPGVIGGYVYRGSFDPRFYGKYVYGDHSAGYWVATESGGIWTRQQITLQCASGSVGCGTFGKLLTFGEDHRQELYISLHTRMLRMVEPSRCGINPPSTEGRAVLIADAYVRSGNFSNTNFGSDTILSVKRAPVDGNFARETFLKFDVSQAVGSFCTLRLRKSKINPLTQPPFQIYVRRLLSDSWTESGITWNMSPRSAMSIFLGPFVMRNGDNVMDVSALVERERTFGNLILTLHLYAVETSNTIDRMDFASKEAGSGPSMVCT